MIGLMRKHDFTLNDVEVMAQELKGMGQGRLDPEPQKRMAEGQLQKYIKEELEAYLEEEEKNNPWAICTSSVGREDKEKYEKCVKSIKAKKQRKAK